ncbi:MAG: phosphoribosylamine--glycine ligase N-terminal domain-containing protein, partial [Pelagibacteraceae bacterium]
MKVVVIGSGGREHALCYKLKKSKKLTELYCIPGNAGTAKICKNIDIDINDFEKIYETVKKNQIDLIIVGPEDPLVNGIVDFF